jgi:hypothetical protein
MMERENVVRNTKIVKSYEHDAELAKNASDWERASKLYDMAESANRIYNVVSSGYFHQKADLCRSIIVILAKTVTLKRNPNIKHRALLHYWEQEEPIEKWRHLHHVWGFCCNSITLEAIRDMMLTMQNYYEVDYITWYNLAKQRFQEFTSPMKPLHNAEMFDETKWTDEQQSSLESGS